MPQKVVLRSGGGARYTPGFSSRLLPPTSFVPFSLEPWVIAAELSLHVDDVVVLAARCLSAVIATRTAFSDTFRATDLLQDDGYLPVLLRLLGARSALVPRRRRGRHSVSESRQFRGTHGQVCTERGALPDGPGDRANEHHHCGAREATQRSRDAIPGLRGEVTPRASRIPAARPRSQPPLTLEYSTRASTAPRRPSYWVTFQRRGTTWRISDGTPRSSGTVTVHNGFSVILEVLDPPLPPTLGGGKR